jgi:hypothetical protein
MAATPAEREFTARIESVVPTRLRDDIPDPRKARGQPWSVGALLSTAVFSLMAMARSLRGAERFSEDLAAAQRKRGISRRVPDSTLGDFLAAVAPQELRRHLHREVLAEHRRKALEPTVGPIRAISIDGKTVATLSEEANKDCQKQSLEGQEPYWLYRVARATLISSTAALCIDQEAIPAETNDMGVFARFFAKLETTYRRADLYELVSTDAGFTSEANARQVDEAGKAYLMVIKGNRPELHKEAQRVLWKMHPRRTWTGNRIRRGGGSNGNFGAPARWPAGAHGRIYAKSGLCACLPGTTAKRKRPCLRSPSTQPISRPDDWEATPS